MVVFLQMLICAQRNNELSLVTKGGAFDGNGEGQLLLHICRDNDEHDGKYLLLAARLVAAMKCAHRSCIILANLVILENHRKSATPISLWD